MSDHPELYYWVYLLPLALLAFWLIRYNDEKLKVNDLPKHLILAGVTYFALWIMGFFTLLIYPIILGAFAYFLFVIVRSKNSSKGIAAAMLGLFLVTGLYAHSQAKKYGAYWELSKKDQGGSFSWLTNAAKERRFTREQLLEYVESKEVLVRKNARTIAELTAKEESDPAEAYEFYESLREIDPELASKYFLNVPFELQNEMGEGEVYKREILGEQVGRKHLTDTAR